MPVTPTPSTALLSVVEAAALLRCSRTRVFSLIKEREIRRLRIGRKALIPLDDLNAYLARLLEAA